MSHFFSLPGGRLGVEIFFVLSGLLMADVLFDARTPLGTFYRRRVARVFPVFFLYLGVVALYLYLSAPAFPYKEILYNAVFLQAYQPTSVGDPARELWLGHLWSLNVEEHSYVLLSLVALVIPNRRTAALTLLVAAACCVLSYWIYTGLNDASALEVVSISWRSECAALPLLASASLRHWLRDIDRSVGRAILGAASLLIVLSIVCSRYLGGSVPLDYVVKPIALAFVVNTLHTAPQVLRRLLSMPVLRWFGVCSFSLYLWQQPFYIAVKRGQLPPWTACGLAVALGALSFYLFETPMRRWIRGTAPRQPVPPITTNAAAS